MKRALALVALVWSALAIPATAQSDNPPDWDDASVVFVRRCIMCHSELGPSRGLRPDTYAAAQIGSQRGAALLPGDPDASELMLQAARGKPAQNALSGTIPAAQDEIEGWIAAGLPEGSG